MVQGKLLAVFLLLFVALTSVGWSSGEEVAEQNDEFDGKIVTVYLGNKHERSGSVLKNLRFKDVGGRKFVFGTAVDTGSDDNWAVGLQVGFPLETVSWFYVATKEQYKKMVEKRRKEKS